MYGLAYIEQAPVPHAQTQANRHYRQPPHAQGCRGQREIDAAGANLLLLPKYSPDLNPIELFFFKLKAVLRKAAERTIPNLFSESPRSLEVGHFCRSDSG